MGKFTDALKKVAEQRLERIHKLDERAEVKYEFVTKKTLDSKIDPRIISFYDPQSPVTEQYRVLRTNLAALSKNSPLKMLTITSAIHGEGKTITAVNLAVSMAHDLNKKSILLVDADMRRSRISKYLGIETEQGLSELISDDGKPEDTLVNIGIDNLTILPAGKHPKNPAELIGSVKFKNLIDRLKAKFDYVIFDTPPIVSVTDSGLLGAQTDGVLMVIQASRTQKGIIKHAQNLLKQARAKVIGAILTNIQYHIPAYIYRYL